MKHTCLWVGAVCILLASACSGSNNRQEDAQIYTDDYGRKVMVPQSPKRIVSTSPAVTEIIFALGCGDLLVGRTDFCSYPPDALSVESIGGISNLNVEKIVSLNPDLVISGSMIPKKSTDQLERMGVATVHVIEKQQFEGLYENIGRIGLLIGRTAQADSLNAVLQERVNTLLVGTGATAEIASSGVSEINPNPLAIPTVYYVVGYGASGNFTAGGDSFINDIIRMAGGKNVAEETEGWSYSLEALFEAEPDFIVIRREDSATFCQMQPYNRLKAVKQHHIIGITSGLIDLQGPRNIEAIEYLHKALSSR